MLVMPPSSFQPPAESKTRAELLQHTVKPRLELSELDQEVMRTNYSHMLIRAADYPQVASVQQAYF